METFLLNLPTVFTTWAGILISWSVVVMFGLLHVLYRIKELGYKTRNSDFVSIGLAFIGGSIFAAALFVFPDYTSLFIDAMTIAAFWYSMLLGYITGSNLSGWTAVIFKPDPRDQ